MPNGLKNVYEVAQFYARVSKQVLIRDGYHVPLAILILGRGLKIIPCPAAYQAEKYVVHQEIARIADQLSAVAAIFINEVWTISMEKYDGRRASQYSEREEALSVMLAVRDGRVRYYSTPFKRGLLGRIILEETGMVDAKPDNFNLLRPLWKVWGVKVPDQPWEPRKSDSGITKPLAERGAPSCDAQRC